VESCLPPSPAAASSSCEPAKEEVSLCAVCLESCSDVCATCYLLHHARLVPSDLVCAKSLLHHHARCVPTELMSCFRAPSDAFCDLCNRASGERPVCVFVQGARVVEVNKSYEGSEFTQVYEVGGRHFEAGWYAQEPADSCICAHCAWSTPSLETIHFQAPSGSYVPCALTRSGLISVVTIEQNTNEHFADHSSQVFQESRLTTCDICNVTGQCLRCFNRNCAAKAHASCTMERRHAYVASREKRRVGKK
jgi:hypothetical protein